MDAQEEAEITILEISYLGGFVKYDLHTKDGNVDVVRSYYGYENGNMKRGYGTIKRSIGFCNEKCNKALAPSTSRIEAEIEILNSGTFSNETTVVYWEEQEGCE